MFILMILSLPIQVKAVLVHWAKSFFTVASREGKLVVYRVSNLSVSFMPKYFRAYLVQVNGKAVCNLSVREGVN